MGISTRGDLAALADRLLTSVRPFTSPGGARITLPGDLSSYGRDIDGLEGFMRTFMLAGFQVAGDGGHDPAGHMEFYARGIAAGTDPTSRERWTRLDEHKQPRVEAATLALTLDMTRPWLWDKLDAKVQRQVIDYLAPAATQDLWYAFNNWIWFRIIVHTFLRSVDGPHDVDAIRVDLAQHDLFCHDDGWIRDGEVRAFDYYSGWALHTYPTLWAGMTGAADLAAGRRASDRERLARYLADYVHLVGADGAPVFQGRSLTYRFASAAPLWVGVLSGIDTVDLGLLRDTATSIIDHFVRNGAPDEQGLLGVGWFHDFLPIAQDYSGTGTPYWASKGLLGLLLPDDHPVWEAPSEPLAVTRADHLQTMASPGWLLSSTADDGIVRLVNHGTDNSTSGAQRADDPFYARLGYSSATTPLLDSAGIAHPLDQSATIVNDTHESSHRTGFDLVDLRRVETPAGPIGVAASVADVRWVREQEVESAGVVTTISVVRGATEVRLVRGSALSREAAGIRLGGWSLAAADPLREQVPGGVQASTPGLFSSVTVLTGSAMAAVDVRTGASPVARTSATPFLQFPAQEGLWVAAAIHLGGSPLRGSPAIEVAGTTLVVTWPDGSVSPLQIPALASV